MIDIQMVHPKTGTACVGLTFPFYRQVLISASPEGPALALCYRVLGVPLGLILGHIADDPTMAFVLSLFVDKGCRNQGIGTALMMRMESELASRGCKEVRAEYKADGLCSPILERLLRKLNWDPPRPHQFTYRVMGEDFHRLIMDPWVDAYYLPPAFTIFPWSEASQEELNRIRQMPSDSSFYRAEADPFVESDRYEKLNSLGLRYKGEIVGWMITRRAAPGLILYDRWYVRDELQGAGRAPAILAESLKRHYAREGHLPGFGACFRVEAGNKPMLRFTMRRMGAYLTSVLETKASRKLLQNLA
jgi:GNAT superfamily N-acetyltransferase